MLFIEAKKAIEKSIDTTNDLKKHNIPNETILKIISNENTNPEIDKCILDDSILFKKVMEYHINYFENKSAYNEFNKILNNLTQDFINKNNNIKRKNIIYAHSVIFNFFKDNYIYNELYKINKNEIVIPHEKPSNLLSTYVPRINQKEACDILKKYGLQTGIHCQATGCGKSFIIIQYIDYVFKNYKENSKIILFT